MASFIVALVFFPIFDSAPGEFIGLSLVNTVGRSAEVKVTAYTADGSNFRSGTIILPSRNQRASLISEILGSSESPPMGWIRIDSSEPGLASYLTSGADSRLEAAEPASAASNTNFLPHISVNTGFTELAHSDTLVMLVNPAAAVANARAELIGLNGSVTGMVQIEVAPLGAKLIRVSKTFSAALPSNGQGGKTFEGYLRVTSSSGLMAWQRIDMPSSRRILRGYTREELVSTRVAMAPHFVSGGRNLYKSVLNIVNPTNTSVTLELKARDDRGRGVGESIRQTLGPGQALRGDILSLFRVVQVAVFPPPLLTGYIQIGNLEGTPFQIIGNIDISAAVNGAAMTSPLQASAAQSWVVPFALNRMDYFTGYAIVNPNELATVQMDVSIEVLKSDGSQAGTPRTVSLSPSSRITALVEEDIRSGYLRITADSPVTVLGSIGRRDLSSFAPILPLPLGPIEETHFFSFEEGMEGWEPRATDLELGRGEIHWSVTRTRELARHGSTSAQFYLENNNDAGKIWIERQLVVKPNRTYQVGLRFAFGSSDYGELNHFTIIAGVLPKRPENAGELIYQEKTGNGLPSPGFKWLEKSYSFTVQSSPEGAIYAAVGVWGTHEVVRSYLVDAIEVSLREQ